MPRLIERERRRADGPRSSSFQKTKKKKKNRYLDATSEWTLDYPPLFAYFERALACLARVVAPRALTLQREPLEGDPATVAFQRLSVVAADLALAAVAWRLTSTSKNKKSKKTSSSSSFPSWVPFLLVFASPGLLIVDSIHFQYNAPLIALLLLAVSKAARSGSGSGSGSGRSRNDDLAAAAAFAVLVCSKHLFACLGPLFALHLLGRCLGRGKAAMLEDAKKKRGGEKKKGKVASAVAAAFAASASHAFALAAVVAAVVAAAFAPFALSMPSLRPLLERLFPFDRGLLHAYWAANAWALVAGADVALSAALRVVAPKVEALLLPVTTAAGTTTTTATTITTTIAKTSSSFLSSLAEGRGSGLASGLVQRTEFAVFPTPGAGAAALCVLLAQAPALLSALRSGFASASASSPSRKKSTPSFAAAAQYCLLCSFVWGYHVHEKAILPALALSAWRAFCDEIGESDDDDDGNRDDTNNDDGRGIARGPRSYFLLSLPALHALLPLLAPARGLEREAAFLLLVAHALFLLSLDAFVKARRSPPPSSLFSSPLERAAALLLCSLEVACVLAWPLLAPPRLAERLPFAPLAATSLVCAAGVCGCWLADALRWWRVALFRGGRGGGKDLEGKKVSTTTTTARGRKAVPATAAVTDAAASTKATTSASPSLAARRPRRAAAAAAAKA